MDSSDSKKQLYIGIGIFIILVILGFFIWHGMEPKPPKEEVGVINGEKILKTEFDRRVQALERAHQAVGNPPEFYANVREEAKEFFVKLILMRQALSPFNAVPTDKDVQAELERRAAEFGGLESYQQLLKERYHWDFEDVRLLILYDLMERRIVDYFASSAQLRAIWISSPVGDTPYSEISELPLDLRLAHEEQRKFARSILVRAQSGEDFISLVRQYSEDLPSKEQDGDLEWLKAGMSFPNPTVQETVSPQGSYQPLLMLAFQVASEILKMDRGETEQFDYPGGFLIVKIEDKKGARYTIFQEWYKEAKSSADIIFY